MPPIPKADRLLRRITTLHEQLQQDDDSPSRLERDLMLGYLREFYTVYAGLDEPKEKPKPEEETAPERISAPSPQPAPAPPPPAAPQPVITPPPPSSPNFDAPPPVPNAPVPPPPAPTFTAHTARVEPMISDRPAPNPPQPAPASNLSPEVEALFEEKDQSGIAGRMMRQRVTDLNRALSINNRVLFANKLFDGNEGLNEALKTLNLRGSFANAKPLLIDLAQQHDWAREDRQETAREFIDLVRRRYA
ncbi:hypothetical protein [Neolewinella sp.]|uniref:hypothetical protein n=1 Tax=Neolewinella sp. TaxID=2993543 RepID=UPI003B519D76